MKFTPWDTDDFDGSHEAITRIAAQLEATQKSVHRFLDDYFRELEDRGESRDTLIELIKVAYELTWRRRYEELDRLFMQASLDHVLLSKGNIGRITFYYADQSPIHRIVSFDEIDDWFDMLVGAGYSPFRLALKGSLISDYAYLLQRDGVATIKSFSEDNFQLTPIAATDYQREQKYESGRNRNNDRS